MFFEPKACWRHIDPSERRTAIDFAEEMGKLVDVHYPEAEKNFPTHLCLPSFSLLSTFLLAMRLWMPRFLSAPRHHPMPIPKPFPLHPA